MNAGKKKKPSIHHPRRRNVTTSVVGLKKTVAYAHISPKKMANPRDTAGNAKKKKKKKTKKKRKKKKKEKEDVCWLVGCLTSQQHASV